VGGEDGAVEEDGVAGAVGRSEVPFSIRIGSARAPKVGERAAVNVLEDVAVGQAAEQLAGQLDHGIGRERHAPGAAGAGTDSHGRMDQPSQTITLSS